MPVIIEGVHWDKNLATEGNPYGWKKGIILRGPGSDESFARIADEYAKSKLRRCAAHLQGSDTSYFSRAGDLNAINLLYRLADKFTPRKPAPLV